MIASRIRRLIAEQKVLDKKTGKLRPARYSDIVILTRSVKGIADIFVQELNREGIPAFSGTKEDICDAGNRCASGLSESAG